MEAMDLLVRIVGSDNGPILLWQMLARATIIFFYGLVLLRLATPRLWGKTTPVDVVMAMIIGSNLSRTLTGNAPFLDVLITTGFLVALHALLTRVAIKWRFLSILIKGRARVLAKDGEVDKKAMKASAVGKRDLMAAIREAGGTDFDQVKLATLERNGDIDVILKS